MSTSKVFSLIPKIMAEVGVIEKSRNNQAQGYAFRGIDDVYAALQDPLAKYGVFFAPTVLEQTREERQTRNGGAMTYTVLKVKYTFYADDGSNFEVVTVGEAMDSGDKSSNKAMSAALKYALLQVFCVPTEEDKDTENNSPQPRPRAAKKESPRVPNSTAGGPVASGASVPKPLSALKAPNPPNPQPPADTTRLAGQAERSHVMSLVGKNGWTMDDVLHYIAPKKKIFALTMPEYHELTVAMSRPRAIQTP